MKESSVYNIKYLQIKWISCTKKFNVSIIFITGNSLSKVSSDQVWIVCLWVCECCKFSFCDCFKVSINIIFNNFSLCVSRQVNIKENICEWLLCVVRIDSCAINDSNSMIQEQSGIKTLNILVI